MTSQPTPIDEARGGLHIVEQSLWTALPRYLRRLSLALKKHTGMHLPIECAPMRFASWMGGDRDGNPNVTAKITHDVIHLARWYDGKNECPIGKPPYLLNPSPHPLHLSRK